MLLLLCVFMIVKGVCDLFWPRNVLLDSAKWYREKYVKGGKPGSVWFIDKESARSSLSRQLKDRKKSCLLIRIGAVSLIF